MTLFYPGIQIFILLLTSIGQNVVFCTVGDGCDQTRQEAPCGAGEICRGVRQAGVCNSAVACTLPSDCTAGGLPPLCTAGFCQPDSCATTGQCVTGQICSVVLGHCVNQTKYTVQDGVPTLQVQFSEQGTPGTYNQIVWSKGNPPDVIVAYVSDLRREPLYQGDYCYGSSSCNFSTRISLNTNTGQLTINDLDYADSDYYYYKFQPDNTGGKYEIHVEVYIQPALPTLEGPIGIIDITRKTTLTCTVGRIRPAAKEMYWMIGDVRINGSTEIGTQDPSDQSLSQVNEISSQFSKDQQGNTAQCVVVPQYGNQVSASFSVDLGYGPKGKPLMIVNPEGQQYEGKEVSFHCGSFEHGKPRSYTYMWKRDGIKLPNVDDNTKDTLAFVVTPRDEGNYSCVAKNEYGETEESAQIQLLVGNPPPADDWSAAVIAGVSVGAAFLVIAVTAGIVYCIWRRRRSESQERRSTHMYDDTIVIPATRTPNNDMGKNEKANRESDPANYVYDYINLPTMREPTNYKREIPEMQNFRNSESHGYEVPIKR